MPARSRSLCADYGARVAESFELEVKVSYREARGNCFIPFHFREAAANLLTIDEIDPFGKIPEFKFCAVRIEPARTEAMPDAEGHA